MTADLQALRDLMREASADIRHLASRRTVVVALLMDYLLRGEPAAELVEK